MLGSLNEAAKRLNTSTSAASRLIVNLEQDLNLTLFSRANRRLLLTEDGDLFYRSIMHTLDGLDEIPVLAGDIRRRYPRMALGSHGCAAGKTVWSLPR